MLPPSSFTTTRALEPLLWNVINVVLKYSVHDFVPVDNCQYECSHNDIGRPVYSYTQIMAKCVRDSHTSLSSKHDLHIIIFSVDGPL